MTSGAAHGFPLIPAGPCSNQYLREPRWNDAVLSRCANFGGGATAGFLLCSVMRYVHSHERCHINLLQGSQEHFAHCDRHSEILTCARFLSLQPSYRLPPACQSEKSYQWSYQAPVLIPRKVHLDAYTNAPSKTHVLLIVLGRLRRMKKADISIVAALQL